MADILKPRNLRVRDSRFVNTKGRNTGVGENPTPLSVGYAYADESAVTDSKPKNTKYQNTHMEITIQYSLHNGHKVTETYEDIIALNKRISDITTSLDRTPSTHSGILTINEGHELRALKEARNDYMEVMYKLYPVRKSPYIG